MTVRRKLQELKDEFEKLTVALSNNGECVDGGCGCETSDPIRSIRRKIEEMESML